MGISPYEDRYCFFWWIALHYYLSHHFIHLLPFYPTAFLILDPFLHSYCCLIIFRRRLVPNAPLLAVYCISCTRHTRARIRYLLLGTISVSPCMLPPRLVLCERDRRARQAPASSTSQPHRIGDEDRDQDRTKTRPWCGGTLMGIYTAESDGACAICNLINLMCTATLRRQTTAYLAVPGRTRVRTRYMAAWCGGAAARLYGVPAPVPAGMSRAGTYWHVQRTLDLREPCMAWQIWARNDMDFNGTPWRLLLNPRARVHSFPFPSQSGTSVHGGHLARRRAAHA
ncbi:hypothetical protein F4861DRAFT_525954 [Xylaria intraflava]|nr:hypothetical protein F4861DRAFT_525954 [Xylaria intraflava]